MPIIVTVGEVSKEYSDLFVKVLRTDMGPIEDWIFNDIEAKHRAVADRLIRANTVYNPGKMGPAEKDELLKTIELKQAEEEEPNVLQQEHNSVSGDSDINSRRNTD